MKITLVCLLFGGFAYGAMTLDEAVSLTLQNNHDIISKNYNNSAYEEYVHEKRGEYLPSVDLSAYVGAKKSKIDFDSGLQSDDKVEGSNAELTLTQVVYDKSVFSGNDEAKYQYLANKYKNANDVETILLNTIDSYLNIVKYQKQIAKTREFLEILSRNYNIAKRTQKISKAVLDKVQTKAKILSTKNNLTSQLNSLKIAQNYFLKNTGVMPKGEFMEPRWSASIDAFDTLSQKALKQNYKILSQVQSIKQKAAILSKEKGLHYPKLNIILSASYDHNIEETPDANTKIYSAKLQLDYNLFNGLSDRSRIQRQKLFLSEAQSELTVVTNDTINELSTAYDTFIAQRQQLQRLKDLLFANNKIVNIYKDQFRSGSRSFIDVLEVQMNLYNTKLDIIDTQKSIAKHYYEILKLTSTLKKSFLEPSDG